MTTRHFLLFAAASACVAGSGLAQAPAPEVPSVPAVANPGPIDPPTSPTSPLIQPSTQAPGPNAPLQMAPAPVPSPIPPPVDNTTPGALPTAPGTAGTSAPGAPTTLGADVPLENPNIARLNEFSGDEVGLVLRTLARQARMNIVVSEKVVGTITMRLEDKTPREAIQVIVASKGFVMDELNGVYFVKTQEERAKEPTEQGAFTLSYGTAATVVPLLDKQLASGVPSSFDSRTNTVYFRETKSNMDKVLLFLQSVDRPTEQVMIEARLVEVTANPQQAYGINWSGVVGSNSAPQTFRYGGSSPATFSLNDAGVPRQSGLPTATVTDGRFSPQELLFGGGGAASLLSGPLSGQLAILSVPQFAATVRLLNEDADAEFLANPRVVTANNQKAEIKITRAQPVPSLNFNEQTAQAVFSGFTDKEFGNTLVVTPVINKDNFVTMTVKPEISNKVGDATFVFSGATVTSPVIDKRSLESNVLIKSGDTLAIGGLLQDEVSKSRTKVPVLGDLPGIGYLFQEKRNSRVKRNLLVFITPTIIKQGYGTGLESQVSGLTHSGEEFADPNGWRNNAKGSLRLVPTSNRQVAADYPKPGVAPAPATTGKKRK